MNLPVSIWNLIFQYDSTYHEKYRTKILEEFKRCVVGKWKVTWINSDRKTEYEHTEKYAQTIRAYWNETYATFYGLSPSHNPEQCYVALNIYSILNYIKSKNKLNK